MSKVKTVQQKYNRLTQWTKEIKNYIYKLRTKLSKTQTGKQTKEGCQVGNKPMETKLTNMLRGKKRKNVYAKLNSSRWGRFIYIKD